MTNFAAQRIGAIVQKPEGPQTYDLKIRLSPSGNLDRGADGNQEIEFKEVELKLALLEVVPHDIRRGCRFLQGEGVSPHFKWDALLQAGLPDGKISSLPFLGLRWVGGQRIQGKEGIKF